MATETGVALDDPELLALAWELLAQEWATLRKMCEIAARKDRLRQDTWEEAMSEVVARLPQFLASYDPSAGRALRSHVIGSARWYLYKLFVTQRRQCAQRRDAMIADAALRPSSGEKTRAEELEDQLQVQSIMEELHPFHKSVLQLYYMSGLTLEELGGVLECSKNAARNRVVKALESARSIASIMR